MYSPYQTQFFAWQLTRRLSSEDEDKLTGAIMDARIDLNPHQVDAALFVFKNPLNKGVLLADEVGLGKTIEAGLVIAQKWAERKTQNSGHYPCKPPQAMAPGDAGKVWSKMSNHRFCDI